MEDTSGTHEFTSGVAQSYIFFLSTKIVFFPFSLDITLSLFPRFMNSEYFFGICKLFLEYSVY